MGARGPRRGVRNTDPGGRARTARVSASSTLGLPAVEPGPGTEDCPLDRDPGIVRPVETGLDGFELLVGAAAPTALRVELWDTVRGGHAVPVRRRSTRTAAPVPSAYDWVPREVQPELPVRSSRVLLVTEPLGVGRRREGRAAAQTKDRTLVDAMQPLVRPVPKKGDIPRALPWAGQAVGRTRSGDGPGEVSRKHGFPAVPAVDP
ncbi:hypothetical protein [Streptomyces sp. NPDC058240]|uniref:hypothetical protein n=1 Tax=Streptomyces sp. NPDC058240 TaxID=3346396 RepID=UPI0036EE8AE2